MSCSPFDLKDYFLKELTDPQQRQMEAHVQTCNSCREELDRLRLTEAALFSLREEEIPQRIDFVSDPVFGPSRWQRGWAAFWGSSARLGFAGAAVLSAAILFSTFTRVASTPISSADVDHRIQAAVTASEARQTATTTKLVHDLVQRVDTERDKRLLAEDTARYLQKLNFTMEHKSGDWSSPAAYQGEQK